VERSPSRIAATIRSVSFIMTPMPTRCCGSLAYRDRRGAGRKR
jgi:hypothetical protein